MLSKLNFFIAVIAFSFVSFSNVSAEEVDLSVLDSIGSEATGVSKRCVSHTRIRRTEVIDDYTILFHMTGGKSYANIMERQCFRMGSERAIKYEVRGGTLCNVDTIEVFTPGFPGPKCSLGDFYEIEKVEVKNTENKTVE